MEQPAKLAQKDLDACWTKKRGETYCGYKNHVNVDQEYKLIRTHEVTDASVHDSQMLDEVLDVEAKGRTVWGPAYRSVEREGGLSEHGLESRICERSYRNRLMTDEQKSANKKKPAVRARLGTFRLHAYQHERRDRSQQRLQRGPQCA